MHAQVLSWFERQVADAVPAGTRPSVLEVGSLDINGSVRPLLRDAAHYHGIDLVPGAGVDEVADAAHWVPPRRYQVVACAEVLEHAPAWRRIMAMMWSAVEAGGVLLMTCATDPRPAHSAVDGWDVRDGEHYANVGPGEVLSLVQEWEPAAWSLQVALDRGDLYLRADRSGPGSG